MCLSVRTAPVWIMVWIVVELAYSVWNVVGYSRYISNLGLLGKMAHAVKEAEDKIEFKNEFREELKKVSSPLHVKFLI